MHRHRFPDMESLICSSLNLEFSLKNFKKLPIYKTVKKIGPNHNPFFQVNVKIENSKKFLGEGNSKKNAEQNAALKLIRSLNI